MPEQENETERKLHKLADRLRLGWQKLHPANEKDLELVRQVVREQWDKEQTLAQKAAKDRKVERAKQNLTQGLGEKGHERESDQNQTKQATEKSRQRDRNRHR
jgi:hypothetical protein